MTHTSTEIAAMIDDLECIDRGGVLHAKRPKQPHPICDKAAAMLRDVAAERDAWRDKYNALGDQALREVDKLGTECGRKDALLDAAAADLASASRERDRLAAMVEKLRGYAVHDDDCDHYQSLKPLCTCGLSDVLKESNPK